MTKADTILYACAGCSGAGQLAYKLALALDERGNGEMSCLAGIAAEIPVFKKRIHGRNIVVIDGCPIECAGSLFKKLHLPIHEHIKLHALGVSKNEPNPDELVEPMLKIILSKGTTNHEAAGN